MPVYIIQTRLQEPAASLPKIDSALESLIACERPFPGTWIVEAALASHQIEQMIEPHLRPDDGLLIIRTAQEAAWRNVAPHSEEWLANNLKRNLYGSRPYDDADV